jgi:hypothetical protein
MNETGMKCGQLSKLYAIYDCIKARHKRYQNAKFKRYIILLTQERHDMLLERPCFILGQGEM